MAFEITRASHLRLRLYVVQQDGAILASGINVLLGGFLIYLSFCFSLLPTLPTQKSMERHKCG